MTIFQWTAGGVTLLLLSFQLYGLWRRRGSRAVNVLLVLIWLAALAAILRPELTSRAADLVGIGRGVDLVQYGFMLFTLVAGFALYMRLVSLEQKLTYLLREDALKGAHRGADVGVTPEGPTAP